MVVVVIVFVYSRSVEYINEKEPVGEEKETGWLSQVEKARDWKVYEVRPERWLKGLLA